jgi:hypothetical protein
LHHAWPISAALDIIIDACVNGVCVSHQPFYGLCTLERKSENASRKEKDELFPGKVLVH